MKCNGAKKTNQYKIHHFMYPPFYVFFDSFENVTCPLNLSALHIWDDDPSEGEVYIGVFFFELNSFKSLSFLVIIL